MKRSFSLGSAAALLSVLALAACSSTPTQRSAGESVDDGVLSGKVKAALIDDDLVKAGDVNVDVYRGVVQLNGFVGSTEEKTRATTAAKSVSGVKEVRNNLEVKGITVADADRSTGEVIDDATLTGKVKAALIDDEMTKAYQINVETHQSVVELGGFVDSSQAKSRASQVAGSVSGVKEVRNDLQVKPKS